MGRLIFLAIAFMLVSSAAWAQIKGFELNDTNWTYTEGDWEIQGILVKPEGDGPFPAILVSHGKGSNAAGFARSKAREFAKWGLVTIAVDYTHSGSSSTKGADGASKENIRRALKCLEILRGLSYVDGKRLAAYGNSMGAFLTIALAAEPEAKLLAAAITAGGTSGRPGFPAPDAEVAKRVKTPLLILHGESDQVVPAERSEQLKAALDESKLANERKTYPGEGHNLHRSQESDVYARIRAWLLKFKVLTQ
jgi:dienelactone hydrolase